MLLLKLLLCVLCVVLTIFFALFARATERLAATSVIDALNAVNLFRRKIATDLQAAQKMFDDHNISTQDMSKKADSIAKRPPIIKYGTKIAKLFVMVVGFTIIFWDFYIGAVQPSINEVILPLLLCWAVFIICITIFFTAQIRAFIALPKLIYSLGGMDVLFHIRQIRLKLILAACSWALCITAAFGTLFSILYML